MLVISVQKNMKATFVSCPLPKPTLIRAKTVFFFQLLIHISTLLGQRVRKKKIFWKIFSFELPYCKIVHEQRSNFAEFYSNFAVILRI